MKTFQKIATTLMLTLGLLMPIASLVTATPTYAACNTAKSCAQEGVCSVDREGCKTDPNTSVSSIITTVINLLSLLVGVAAVIMIIVGGFKYIVSSGDASNVTGAKNTILYAIVGLVIVALAQVIVRFVIAKT